MRTAPVADQEWVPGSSADDLDADLVRSWRAAVRQRDPNGIGRFSDEDMLLKAGVLSREGSVSKAGLLAMGVYPQQHFPRMVVHVADMRSIDPQRRARNIASLSGAIPSMLASAVEWVNDNAGTVTVETANGSLQERPTYPAVAVRELIANALVHRDLEAWSEGQAVDLRLVDPLATST